MGEDAAGVETVAKLEDSMRAFGVAITDGNHSLLSTYDIIKQIADKWDSFNTEQRASIASLAAGKIVPVHTVMCA